MAEYAHPEVLVVESPFALTAAMHCNPDRTLCLQLPDAHEINYERDRLVGLFSQIVVHLDRSRIAYETGIYPGPEYSHGEIARVEEFYGAQLPAPLRRLVGYGMPLPPRYQWCPCGAPLRFAKCHRAELIEARRRYRAAVPYSKPQGLRRRGWRS